ncbi:hypothetical protein [Aquipuribacter nitratireducens]|uniref:Uncharacterized protein n=1 Tax=Aquipuribacter nitratireducens TaxID=650104 RepID=A0ABW0GKM4_9MICO
MGPSAPSPVPEDEPVAWPLSAAAGEILLADGRTVGLSSSSLTARELVLRRVWSVTVRRRRRLIGESATPLVAAGDVACPPLPPLVVLHDAARARLLGADDPAGVRLRDLLFRLRTEDTGLTTRVRAAAVEELERAGLVTTTTRSRWYGTQHEVRLTGSGARRAAEGRRRLAALATGDDLTDETLARAGALLLLARSRSARALRAELENRRDDHGGVVLVVADDSDALDLRAIGTAVDGDASAGAGSGDGGDGGGGDGGGD